MAKMVLISCVSKKLNYKSKAQDLYISPLFKKNLKYARSLNPDIIFILSAKYGLLKLNKKIEPYNKTLNNMNSKKRKMWASVVVKQLQKVSNLSKDKFIFLAGSNYRKYLLPNIKHYQVPMMGLTIGKQLKWLTIKIKDN